MTKNRVGRVWMMRMGWCGLLLAGGVWAEASHAAGVPTDNPVAAYYAKQPDAVPGWITALRWSNVVTIADFEGDDGTRLAKAQEALKRKGGGVVYFPAGTYRFRDHIDLEDGVILRGEDPRGGASAKQEDYLPATQFEFPKYHPSMEGNGTPIDTSFKSIRTKTCVASNCGVVNVAIQRGHINFAEAEDHKTGGNRMVFGCLMRNTAAADPDVPNEKYGHLPFQRFTQRHRAAIGVYSGENLFVANNRLPRSGDDNFLVKPYRMVKVGGKEQDFRVESGKPYTLKTLEEGVMFDYDNRPGIYANYFAIGASGRDHANGTPESHPWGFRKGMILRDNYIFNTGRCSIAFCGDGVLVAYNVIRFPEGLVRPTTTGRCCSDGSSTNDNRAIYMRGYRWKLIGNDYIVFSNTSSDGRTPINDGEGVAHENHANSAVVESEAIGNSGNRYICLWVTDIDGLLIKDNKLSAKGAAVHVLADGRKVRNLTVSGNELSAGGITVTTADGQNIVISGNTYTGVGTNKIVVTDLAWVANDNINFMVAQPPVTGKK